MIVSHEGAMPVPLDTSFPWDELDIEPERERSIAPSPADILAAAVAECGVEPIMEPEARFAAPPPFLLI